MQRVVGFSTSFAAVCLLTLGCGGTYQIKRSALVPSVAPPIMNGHPIDNGRVRLSVGNATYLRAAKPREKPNVDTNAGLHIPRSSFAGQVLVRLGRNVGLGAKMELGLGEGADAIADDVAPRPAGNTFGMGPVAQVWLPLIRGLEVHFHGEVLLFGAPYDEYTRRVDGPTPGPWRLNRSDVNYVWVFTAAAALSYRVGPFAFFAGFSARNQPTNVELQETGAAGVALSWASDEVTGGPVYTVAFGGATVRFLRRFEATVQIYQPLTDNPVQYRGPALGFYFSVALGDPPRALRRPRVQPRSAPPARRAPRATPPRPAPIPELVPGAPAPSPSAPPPTLAPPSDERPT
jgi:hypothetical protein